ncbi:MAG TPA: bifunctional demethylmenaquinone methyltransferase/2-methoxy-6-polyprenyl-1,4-benzoquinol methylase UbiE [Mariniphaga anaerophila]|uniref:Demethylmenaquinone methyltransferase n=1 Tax=Mariniphaga anaerophila TaxID=1484053 RepID=A0A831PR49_9BACT|nr:bifunctional demethylmenaquinone methyltransferase/2-methoxy-6-polyprenyl-1,4-benzoquinol methylase UbiE [Mariniphaga anaerophila]
MAAVPYKNSDRSKKGQVEEMFDQISPRYDFLNHLLSFQIDKIWRRKAVKILGHYKPATILDVATGTGDFAIVAARLNPQRITGIDLSEGMLKFGRKKIHKKSLESLIELRKGDSENLPFSAASFDAAIVGFGVRNFENLKAGLSEIYRVLKPGGAFIVLEFSKPRNRFFRSFYFFYFTRILPWLGGLVSKNSRAYSYLPESVQEFPDGDNFVRILEAVGFAKCRWFPQTFGIATIYEAQKPKNEG